MDLDQFAAFKTTAWGPGLLENIWCTFMHERVKDPLTEQIISKLFLE